MRVSIVQMCFEYGARRALQDISAVAAPGRITAVLGPNASGKSTLLRCIIGALRPSRGGVMMGDRPILQLRSVRLAERIAYVPQRGSVAARFTVRQVVELGRYALPRLPSRVEEAMEQLDLSHLADRIFQELSVGQQQRVTLARAVAQVSPDGCLVLDEPTSAMDLQHVQGSLDVLRRVADTGSTVIVAIHDLITAALAADDAWLLHGGRLVAAGEAREVLTIQRLESVFGVPFESVSRSDGDPIPLPKVRRPARPTIIERT